MDRRRLAAASHHENDRYMSQFDGPPGRAPVARASELGFAGIPFERRSSPSTSAAFLPSVNRTWFDGPIDPSGNLIDLSDRPVLCGCVDPERGIAYVGCSDHAAYAVSTEASKKAAVLFGKKSGHSEWVTAVAVSGDGSGRVVTAGMDAKLIVWAPPAATAGRARYATAAAASQQCDVFTGHFGSISAVACPAASSGWGHVVVSAGASFLRLLRAELPAEYCSFDLDLAQDFLRALFLLQAMIRPCESGTLIVPVAVTVVTPVNTSSWDIAPQC
jgi:hypothetical protein